MDANNAGKRKSRFKKAPQAPKRFKSGKRMNSLVQSHFVTAHELICKLMYQAYIFFSTEMMQQMKNDQRSKKGKSKVR
jgi:hypothetical protein